MGDEALVEDRVDRRPVVVCARGEAAEIALTLSPEAGGDAEGEDDWIPWTIAGGVLAAVLLGVVIGVSVAARTDGRVVDPVFGNTMALVRFP